MVTKLSRSSDPIDQYIKEHSLRLTSEQNEIIEKYIEMLDSFDEGQFFQVIIQLMGCKRCMEVGIFTGYTALTIALALPSDSQLIACDITNQYVRQDIWKKAGISDRITLKIGSAIELVRSNEIMSSRQEQNESKKQQLLQNLEILAE
ncbi:unnamed protein product [Adineta steineri]|uniref:Uncharacterized protein n=1 Tax=Adineta steineri TaxID=433720 RepID=A0A815FPJ6_9BILA|nr:unnamed protein product [Adineta steineri]